MNDDKALIVSQDELTRHIAHEFSINAAFACFATGQTPEPAVQNQLHNTTLHIITMTNGFTVVGMSACADPRLFNAKRGQELARADAIGKLWPHAGWELRQRLADVPVMFQPTMVPASIPLPVNEGAHA